MRERAEKGLFLTTSVFTRGARDEALGGACEIELIDIEHLIELMEIGLNSALSRRRLTPSTPIFLRNFWILCKSTKQMDETLDMAPRVLISDALSPAAVAIFKERGVEVDVKPGLDKDELAKIIGEYDGLAIRSNTKVTAKLLEHATKLKVIGRAGIGVDNVDIPAATARGVIVMNTPFGNSITTAEHAIAMMFALARANPGRRRLDAGRQVGEEPLHGRRDHRQDAGRHRLRQHRLDRRRRAASA